MEAEVTKLAFLHRNKYLGDPSFSNIPIKEMLSERLWTVFKQQN